FVGHPGAAFFRPCSENKDAASRRLLLMSFKRHEEIYPNDRGADHKIDAPAHRSDEFPAGYSLTGCSPALPASASPTGVEYASGVAQLRGCLFTKETEKPKQQDSGSTLIGQFFCPKNGVHLISHCLKPLLSFTSGIIAKFIGPCHCHLINIGLRCDD